jgi:GDP-D-mannose dehydratase
MAEQNISDSDASQKRALICGISGQDGVCPALFLLERVSEVTGGSRNTTIGSYGQE